MEDYCKDKTSPYDIRPEDKSLIQAAIQLGEWLASQPDTDQDQQAAILKMLAFLRNLPNPPPSGLHGEFGFEFCPPGEIGHNGCWSVSVCRAMFEIFCIDQDDGDGFSWELCPGNKNMNDLTYAGEWISQVANPFKNMSSEYTFVIQASTWDVKD